MVTKKAKSKNVIIIDEMTTSGMTESQIIEEPKVMITEPEVIKETMDTFEDPKIIEIDYEYELLKKMMVDCPFAPVFSIIRDTLDDNNPEVWDSILRGWIRKDFYVPVYNIRDGYITKLGKLYALNKYELKYQP